VVAGGCPRAGCGQGEAVGELKELCCVWGLAAGESRCRSLASICPAALWKSLPSPFIGTRRGSGYNVVPMAEKKVEKEASGVLLVMG
jgi:hypothetical protein